MPCALSCARASVLKARPPPVPPAAAPARPRGRPRRGPWPRVVLVDVEQDRFRRDREHRHDALHRRMDGAVVVEGAGVVEFQRVARAAVQAARVEEFGRRGDGVRAERFVVPADRLAGGDRDRRGEVDAGGDFRLRPGRRRAARRRPRSRVRAPMRSRAGRPARDGARSSRAACRCPSMRTSNRPFRPRRQATETRVLGKPRRRSVA